MQIIIGSDLVGLISSLELVKRFAPDTRAEQVQTNCLGTAELVLAISSKYRELYPVRLAADDRMGTKLREAEFYKKHCIIRIAKQDAETVGGYCVLDGELLCLHNKQKGKGDWMLDHAKSDGAVRLNCFDVPPLTELYTRHGFKVVNRQPNWVEGEPDVLIMERAVK